MKKKTIHELNKEHQDRTSKILDDLGIFFAFSDEQFEEKAQEGVAYVYGQHGEIIPEQNVKEYYIRMKEAQDIRKKAYAHNVDMDDCIRYELSSHEAWYTYSIEDAMGAVKSSFPDVTEDDMWRVFKKYDADNDE